MRLYEKVICQRKAMDISQEELAAIVGVDVDVISKFENGEELPKDVYKSIGGRLRDYIGRLDLERRLQISILSRAFELSYQGNYEKRHTLNYIIKDVGKLGIELYKPETKEEVL